MYVYNIFLCQWECHLVYKLDPVTSSGKDPHRGGGANLPWGRGRFERPAGLASGRIRDRRSENGSWFEYQNITTGETAKAITPPLP